MKVFIENKAGSKIKNIYNEQTFEFIKSRPYSRTTPFAYGFVIGTKSGDGDALDCFVLSRRELISGERVDTEPIGMIEYFEDDELDHKVIVTTSKDSKMLNDEDVTRVKEFLLHAFDHLPNKHVRVGRVLGAEEARNLIGELAT